MVDRAQANFPGCALHCSPPAHIEVSPRLEWRSIVSSKSIGHSRLGGPRFRGRHSDLGLFPRRFPGKPKSGVTRTRALSAVVAVRSPHSRTAIFDLLPSSGGRTRADGSPDWPAVLAGGGSHARVLARGPFLTWPRAPAFPRQARI
jgi:hypothetical protein